MHRIQNLFRSLLTVIIGTGLAAWTLASSRALETLPPEKNLSLLSFQKLDIFGDIAIGRVYAIAQGPQGFIWIGTRQGAFRYDGYRVRSFYHDSQDTASLANDTIWTFFRDSENRLWIGTQKGVSRYLPETETFKSYLNGEEWGGQTESNQVNAILENVSGEILATTEAGTIYRYEASTDSFHAYADHNFGLIKSMVEDENGRLWIGRDNAIIRFDPRTGSAQEFQGLLSSVDGVSQNFINSICYVSEEEIWAGTSHRGVVILNGLTGESRVLPKLNQRDEYVNQIERDPKGNVWVATNDGISIHMRDTGEVFNHTHRSVDANTLPLSGTNTFICDSQGNVWTGSDYDGISISTNSKKFSKVPLHRRNPEARVDAPVLAIYEDRARNLWVGDASSGFAIYPPNDSAVIRFENVPGDPSSISAQPVMTFFEDSRGDVWIGTYRGGLHRFLPETQSFQKYLHDPDDPFSIAGHDIRDIDEDGQGNLWLATHGSGISFYDTETQTFQNFNSSNAKQTIPLLSDWANAILCARETNEVWVGTPIGITVIDTKTLTSRDYQYSSSQPGSLSNSTINDLFQDSEGRIWVATNEGLNLYDRSADKFIAFTDQHGFPHKTISSIIEDKQGVIWTGTFDGIARLDPKRKSIKSYSVDGGFSYNEFFEGSALLSQDGHIYFGHNRGLIKFSPKEIVDNTHIPDVHITNLRVFGDPIRIDPNLEGTHPGILKRSILASKELELSYEQNSLTIEFIALNFISPLENRYSYKLEGFDETWSAESNRREANYTNLNPGRYTFRVRASNNDGYWNEIGDTLAITILPPFWGTLWFKSLSVFGILALPTVLVFWRVSSIKAQKQQLEIAVSERTSDLTAAHHKLEEAYEQILAHGENLEATVRQRTKELEIAKAKAERSDKLKSAFLANMSHEIRTPMNAIVGFLHILEDEKLTPAERDQFHGIIRQSSKSLLSLIDDILDLSAIEAGEAEIKMGPCNLSELCDELRSIFAETLAKESKKEVKLVFESEVPEPLASAGDVYILIDALRLKQIIWNLISNAIKFTDEGEIRFTYRIFGYPFNPLEKRIEFKVEDTGIGIPKAQCDQIFNRFHKLDRSGKKLYRGTGLGLAITKTLTELMGGSISVSSTEGKGTSFTVNFPYRPVPLQGTRDHNISESERSIIPDFKGRRILVVEDEVPNFEYIQKVLLKTSAEIEWAATGTEALKAYEERRPDIILLDLKIPEIDGYQVAREIRKTDSAIPIVAQSAYAMRGDQNASIESGADEHLSKPFSPTQLLSTLSKHLSKQESDKPT